MKRTLSFILALLTVVSLIPFGAISAFAAEAEAQEQSSNEESRLPSAETVAQYYNTDSSYWIPIYKQSGVSSLYGKTAKTDHYYKTIYHNSSSRLTLEPVNGYLPVSETGDIIELVRREGATGVWNSAQTGTNIRLSNMDCGFSSYIAQVRIFNNDLSGLDVAIDFDLYLDSTSGTEGGMGIFVTTEQSPTATNNDQTNVQLFGITYDGTEFSIRRGGNSGKVLAKLPADKFVNITILFDVGGSDKATCGNEMYLFVDGELKSAETFLTDTQLDNIFIAQNGYNETDGTDRPIGWNFQSFNIRSGDVFGKLKDLNAYYYDDTPDDSNPKNALRGKNTVGLAFTTDDRYDIVKPLANIPYTFEATVYVPSDLSVMPGTLFGNYYADNSSLNFEILENGRPRISYVERGVAYNVKFSSVDLRSSSGEWVNIAIVIDSANEQARCYINGVLKETVNNAGLASITEGVIKAPFRLGGDFRNGNTTSLTGARVKNIALFDDIRTSGEIANDYKNGIKGNESGLILAYSFDDISDSGKNVTDISGNGYNIKYECPDDWFFTEKSAVTDYAYSFAVVGDTQSLSYTYPEKVSDLYNWILRNKDDKKIAHVMHLGDITEKSSDSEWTNALTSMSVLNGQIPYSIVRGNHDNSAKMNSYFANDAGYNANVAGYYKEGEVNNTYMLFTAGSVDYLLLNLDYGPDDAVLEWAADVIEANSTRKVIITTHAFLYRDGTTIDRDDMCAPNSGKLTNNAEYNNGDDMWNELVSKYENIFLVLSGHDEYDDIVMTQTLGENGNVVTQILIDPQGLDLAIDGGLGMVAMLYFGNDGKTVTVEYYSTVKNAFFKEKNQFTIDITNKVEKIENVDGSVDGILAAANAADQSAWRTKFELAFYQDYNRVTGTTDSALNASAYKYSGYGHHFYAGPISYVSDGNGGYALKRTNYNANLEHTVYLGSYRCGIPTNQGKNFVYSGDYKLDGVVGAGAFIIFGSYSTKSTGTSATQWKATPLWIDGSGKLYATNPNWTTPSGSGVVGGCVDLANNMTYANVKGQYICTLSQTEFTNIAVQVKDNYFKIYVNGVAKTDWLLFMSDSAKELYKDAGDGLYTTGEFAITNITHHYRNKTTNESSVQTYIHDNNVLYFGDEFLGAANGYARIDGKVYYCENGVIVGGKNSADGLLCGDANGVMSLNGTEISTLKEVYAYVGNDLVPIDGVYSGLYTVNGNTYYYDTNKVRVVSKTAYDIKDNNSEISTTVTGYSFDKNGVATVLDGYYLYRYYEDGVKKNAKSDELINKFDSSVETLLANSALYPNSNFELVYFHDYDSATGTTNALLNSSAYKYSGYGHEFGNGPVILVPDGKGGYALKRTNADTYKEDGTVLNGDLNHTVYIGARRQPIAANQGRGFVFSADYKLDGGVTAGQFIVLGSYAKYNDAHFKAIPVWIDVTGKLYATNPNWTTASSSGVVGGCVDLSGKMNYTDAIKGQYLCTLSQTEFTNIAVQVKNNYFRVFVDGVDKTGWLLFMSDSAKELYKTAGDGLYTTGEFAITHVTHYYRSNSSSKVVLAASDNYVQDNTTIYFGDEYLSGVTGYTAYEGNIYYTENGVAKANAVNGIFATDENGIVTYDGERVKTFAEFYRSEGEDLVYVNGVYSGKYKVNGNTYYYDDNKNFVTIEDSDVAINSSNGSSYKDYESAIENANEGDTVTIVNDAVIGNVTLPSRVTLDLNGKTLKVDSMVVFNGSKIIDSVGGGFIEVPKDQLLLPVTTTDTIAIYVDSEDDSKSGYTFTAVTDQKSFENTETGFELIFRPSLNNDTETNKAFFGDGAQDNALNFVVRLEDTSGNTIKEFIYKDSLIAEAYENNLGLKITVKNIPEKYEKIVVSYILISETGMECEINAGIFTR